MECRWRCLLGAERGCVGVCMVCEWNGKAGGAVYRVSADIACMCVCVCGKGGPWFHEWNGRCSSFRIAMT